MATKSATKPAAKSNLKSVPAAEGEAAPEAKKKKPLLLIAIVLVVLLAAGGGAGWYFLGNKPPAAAGKDAKAAPPKEAAKPPVFVTLEPFTVNLAGGEHYLQLGVVLQVADEETAEAVKTHLPQVRNALLLLLSSKTPADLESIEGKQKLAGEILNDTRAPVGEASAKNVQSVLFASFVVQ
jgi:flagellar FliL protein